MDRRAFIGSLSGSLLAAPLAAEAQAGKVYRIGFLGTANPTLGAANVEALRGGLRELGWVEGQNIALEYRWAGGVLDRVPRLVAELLSLNVDVIVLPGAVAARAAIQATRTIPIVAMVADPVETGLVASLARPGGNLTGLGWQATELTTKQLQLLKETAPRVSRIAGLWATSVQAHLTREAARTSAQSLGLRFDAVEVKAPADIPGAFDTVRTMRVSALIVLPSPMFFAERAKLAELTARDRLPAIYEVKEYVEAGGLMSYGPSFPDMYRRAATLVDKILKGARPADLPVEQPTKFEMVINLKTAKALGLTIPPSLLQRADQVIE